MRRPGGTPVRRAAAEAALITIETRAPLVAPVVPLEAIAAGTVVALEPIIPAVVALEAIAAGAIVPLEASGAAIVALEPSIAAVVALEAIAAGAVVPLEASGAAIIALEPTIAAIVALETVVAAGALPPARAIVTVRTRVSRRPRAGVVGRRPRDALVLLGLVRLVAELERSALLAVERRIAAGIFAAGAATLRVEALGGALFSGPPDLTLR